jgi:sulfite exporter TauE/SafE
MHFPALIAASTGLLAGLVHALSGPDHLSAVAPLVVGQRRQGWLAGLFWGIGHSLGVWGVGILALALRGLLPIERLSSWSERMVGAVLIAVGLWGLRRAWLARHPAVEDHGHAHHFDSSRPPKTALWIGSLHGLAGSSHLLGILPALALPSLAASAAYIVGFGLGAIVAMVAFSSALGLVAVRLTARDGRGYQALLTAFSAISIVVGGYWLMS